MTPKSVIWGVCADSIGAIHRTRTIGGSLAGGYYRALQTEEWEREPAGIYARSHPAPIPMQWSHDEDVGEVVALRRAGGNLYAIGECELTTDELADLADGLDGLRWSTGTYPGEPLRIGEISITRSPASVGLPPLRWVHSSDVRNMPIWVREDIGRAHKTANHSRDVLRIYEADATDNYTRAVDNWSPREVYFSAHPGRILSVGGRPVNRAD